MTRLPVISLIAVRVQCEQLILGGTLDLDFIHFCSCKRPGITNSIHFQRATTYEYIYIRHNPVQHSSSSICHCLLFHFIHFHLILQSYICKKHNYVHEEWKESLIFVIRSFKLDMTNEADRNVSPRTNEESERDQ